MAQSGSCAQHWTGEPDSGLLQHGCSYYSHREGLESRRARVPSSNLYPELFNQCPMKQGWLLWWLRKIWNGWSPGVVISSHKSLVWDTKSLPIHPDVATKTVTFHVHHDAKMSAKHCYASGKTTPTFNFKEVSLKKKKEFCRCQDLNIALVCASSVKGIQNHITTTKAAISKGPSVCQPTSKVATVTSTFPHSCLLLTLFFFF